MSPATRFRRMARSCRAFRSELSVKPSLDVARRVPGLLSRPKGSCQDARPDGERLARDARTLGTRVRLAAARTYTGLLQRRSERHRCRTIRGATAITSAA